MDTELALALSARDWTDRLHRFLADHGGARVRVTAMTSDDLAGESFHVLLIDDICSFLSPRLIDLVKSSGRAVIGVYDPDEFADGKARLLEVGVSDVVEATAPPEEFLAVIERVAEGVVSGLSDQLGDSGLREAIDREFAAPVLAIGGPPGGVGVTEVALGVAARTARKRPVVLVDVDRVVPAIGQRLGLPLHPNLLTAIDVLEHRTGNLMKTLHQPIDRLFVVCGIPVGVERGELRTHQMLDLIRQLTRSVGPVVVDLGASPDPAADPVARELVQRATQTVVVGSSHPVGVRRLLDWIAAAPAPANQRRFDVLLNWAPTARTKRGDLVEEITRSYRPASLGLLPTDPTVAEAAWNGIPTETGRFRRALDRWVSSFAVVDRR